MTDKKHYYGLDDIGFIGTQDRTLAQVKSDMKKMSEYIKTEKSGKTIPLSQRRRQLSKVK